MAYNPQDPYGNQPQMPKQPQQPQQATEWNYDTPEGRQAFLKAYDPTGTRSEDMKRFIWTGNEEGVGNESGDTLKRWDPYRIRGGTGPIKYRSARGLEGEWDKPTECPPGMRPSGDSETDPCVPNGQAGGGAGGAGGGGKGGGGGFGGGGGWDNPIYKYLKGKALDEKGWLGNWMGQGGMTGFQQQMDKARAQAMQIQDPTQRAAALARIPQMQAALGTQARQGAEQARMGLLSGTMMPQEFQYVGLGENARQANMQNALGWGGLGVQKELGLGNLDLANRQFGWESGSKWADTLSESQKDRDLQRWSLQEQLKQNKPSFWDRLSGVVGGIGGLATGLGGLKWFGKG